MTSRIVFYSNDLAIWHGFPDITHIKVNNGRHFIELQFFRAFSSMETHILFYSNNQAIWHDLLDIKYIKVNNCRKSAIFNLIDLNFFRTYPFI